MKKLIALLLALVMVLGLVACGAKEEASTATESTESTATESTETEAAEEETTTEEAEDVTLSLWIYDDGENVTALYEEFADAVHEKYPNITIATEVLPYDSGPEKFVVACATNTTPDLYFDGYSRIAPAVKAGLTVDLTDVINNNDVFVAQQTDGVMANGGYGYMATATGAAYCVFVNLDLAERLGVADMLPEDKLTWSYDDVLEICRAAKAADPSIVPIDLFAGTQSSDAYTYSWFIANGVELTNEDLTATAFNEGENREKAIEVLDLYKTLIDEDLTVTGPATMADTDCQELWHAGQVLFFHGAFSNNSSWLKNMEEGLCVPFSYDSLCIPTKSGDAVPYVCNWGSYGYCGFANNGHEEEIKQVLEMWLQDPYWQSQLSNMTGRLSVMSTTTAEWPNESIAVTMERGAAYGAEYARSDFGILESWWADFRGTFYPNLQEFYVGTVDAGTMLDNWQAAADAVISAANAG